MAGPGRRRAAPSHLVVGHMTRPHGTRGEVFVWPLTDRPDDVFVQGRSLLAGNADGELDDGTETLVIHGVRPFKRGFLVGFDDRTDRNAVESLAGRYLLIDRPADAGEADAWYYHELLGMRVVTAGGETVGTVREVYELTPADMLEVEDADGARRLVPLTKQVVVSIDIDAGEAGEVVIDPPPGLLDL